MAEEYKLSFTAKEIDNKLGLIDLKQDKITGTSGQFVVIGADGNVTAKTIAIAEEATFGG